MRAIYSVLVKDSALAGTFQSTLIQHTMLFEHPPTHTDISNVLLDFINPSKRYVSNYVETRVHAWSNRILGGITYYASDLKYREAKWEYTTDAEEKCPFSLTISVLYLNENEAEKKEETASSYGQFAMNQLSKGAKE